MTVVSLVRAVPPGRPILGRPAPTGPRWHPKLELVGDNGARVRLPFAPLGPLGPLGPEWVQVARDGGRAPLLVLRGPQLPTLTLECTVADTRDPEASQEVLIYALTALARQARRITLNNYGILVGNAWRITGLNADPIRRQPGTNAISAATVTIELTGASDAAVRVGSTSGGHKDPAPTKSSTVVVAAGDSLATLALRALGDPNRGAELLDANDLRDARRLTAGQVLTVPSS